MYVRFTPKMRLCRAYGCFPDAQVRVLFLEEGEGPFWARIADERMLDFQRAIPFSPSDTGEENPLTKPVDPLAVGRRLRAR